jgi:ABC-type nickel/cobalt efflux system permease component RcnA
MLIKLNLALAIETMVLIASLFLLIYINKNQLSRWFRYAGIAIVAFILGLMLCTVCCACRMHCKRMNDCEMGHSDGARMHMNQGMGDCCGQMASGCHDRERGMSRHHGSCSMSMGNGCEMGAKEGCCEKMGKGKCGKEDDEDDEEEEDDAKGKCMSGGHDSIVKKEVVIKRK